MLLPLVAAVLASIKPAAEAAAISATYLPVVFRPTVLCDSGSISRTTDLPLQQLCHRLSVESIDLVPRGTEPAYSLAGLIIPGNEVIFVFLPSGLIIPYQALLTPIFLQFAHGC